MSTQRTPPGSRQQLNKQNSTMHYNSDSALNTSSNPDLNDNNYIKITKSFKRTLDDLPFQPLSSISEIKVMFAELKTPQDQKFELLNTALMTIVTQNQEIQKSVETLTHQHQDLLAKINHLELENNEYKQQILTLETKLDFLEKCARGNSIEIRNCTGRQTNENKIVLTDIIHKLGLTLGLNTPIQDLEIRNIFRTKTDDIIVDFNSILWKVTFLLNYKNYNKSKRQNGETVLNSEHINLPGTPRSIYISEYLTTKLRRIFYIARESVKNKKLFAAWTAYGKIYVKKEEGTKPIRVDNESELYKLTL
ncbi:unnamed protein product [Parnassius apollo]|uniref:(apollo) hypothetical protein n=1 Tax=Parnassius apollo TaxID=110799 RepID=A0A8S3XFD7_PARAO|nr:unnamed protein product [Parnassius apollo]